MSSGLLRLAWTIYRHQWKGGNLTLLSYCLPLVRVACRFSAKSLSSLDKTGIINRGQLHGSKINQWYYRMTWKDETISLTVLLDCSSQLGYKYALSLPFSLHPDSRESNKLLSLVEHSFLYISNQNCYLFCDWLTQSSLTSLIFFRRKCLLTDFMVQFDHFSPGGIQPLNSGDQPKTDGSSSTCFSTAKVFPSGLVFLLSSSWVCTLTIMFI